MANSPAEAADGADFIFTCVGNDDDLREVATGENGLFNTAKKLGPFLLITQLYLQKYQEN